MLEIYRSSRIMFVSQAGMAGRHLLVGPNDNRLGPRIVNNGIDRKYRKKLLSVDELKFEFVKSGAYAQLLGPSHELRQLLN
eukprot:m.81916 g.81916  ORF g.81916 m.81916 type:complete len:81 (+) comp12838_c0_seq2:363-605(+)